MLKIDSKMEWTEELIGAVYREIETIAKDELNLDPQKDLYTNQIEIVSAEQMLDAYTSIGLPVHYHHWSFGKDFVKNQNGYAKGEQGLALEIIINSSPCIALLMEENSMLEQTMVLAHACIGHNSVFANNVYFKTWTDATSIIDYMVFAREYIRTCEERYGYDEVEKVIDACHAIQTHGVDKYKRKNKSAFSDDGILQELITADEQRQKELDIILQKTTHHVADQQNETRDEEEENLLYFIMKKSPNLARWKRELVRIIYKINQYFYPQTMCQTVHEGMATFCHHYIMTRLEEKGFLTPDAYLAFLKSHSGVVYQPEYDKKWYSGPNPYALGFNIFRDLKRMCEEPTDEDREWFPNIVGRDWREVVKDAAFNYRDDSFINQFLSPKVIRDMKLFSVAIDYPERVKDKTKAIVSEIHDDIGYRSIRTQLAESKQRVNRTPQISIIGCDLDGDRVLKLKYTTYQNREIDIADAKMVMMHMDYLWGYPVSLKTKD